MGGVFGVLASEVLRVLPCGCSDARAGTAEGVTTPSQWYPKLKLTPNRRSAPRRPKRPARCLRPKG
ncbi:hypothetical protein GCM10009744_60710 [Kribbella alba]|uniref:Secreted protein n=1 Tax=Kribbella alba TaxID=190197 RepID=A0ABN2FTH6_9ACTN